MPLSVKEVPSASWRPRVYHARLAQPATEEWKYLAKIVKSRDKHTCKSCHIKVGLTVHHIIPRDKGGKDLAFNLITLCYSCHNEIEFLEIYTKAEIVDFRRKQKRKYIRKDPHITAEGTPIRWQQWVYGGYNKPICK